MKQNRRTECNLFGAGISGIKTKKREEKRENTREKQKKREEKKK
ncbi:hypothetical protein [Methanimicrococcus blatticola]|nr:hypothetical protein [Methanimicrococcus blatticola]